MESLCMECFASCFLNENIFLGIPSTSAVPMDDVKKPLKKCPLLEARQDSYHLDQERRFKRLMSVLEGQQLQ